MFYKFIKYIGIFKNDNYCFILKCHSLNETNSFRTKEKNISVKKAIWQLEKASKKTNLYRRQKRQILHKDLIPLLKKVESGKGGGGRPHTPGFAPS